MNGSRTPIGKKKAGPRGLPSAESRLGPGYTPANSNTRIHGPRPFRLQAQKADGPMPPPAANLGLNSDRLRASMVARLQAHGIEDARVLAAMRTVPRHLFVDQALASHAYEDAALPIGFGQTISQPWVVARMLAAVCEDRTPTRVLEVGAGCGYQAAVLAQFVREVHAVERVRGLVELAHANLAQVPSASRVRLHFADGAVGLKRHAPFDGIVVAAAGVKIPEALLQQLALGARLIAPVGTRHQSLVLIERVGPDAWHRRALEDVRFVPLRPGTQI